MTLSIQNLLSEIDPNDTQYQDLDAVLTGAKRSKDGTTVFSFGAPMDWGMVADFSLVTDRKGLVVWLDRKELGNIIGSADTLAVDNLVDHESHLRLLRTSLQYLAEKGVEWGTLTNPQILGMLESVDTLFKK